MADEVPAFYVAGADLMVGDPASGAMPMPAYRKGDRVPAYAVAEHEEWAALVTAWQQEASAPALEPEDGAYGIPQADAGEPDSEDDEAAPAAEPDGE